MTGSKHEKDPWSKAKAKKEKEKIIVDAYFNPCVMITNERDEKSKVM